MFEIVVIFYRWLHEINQNCDDVSRILVGNKCEDPERRVVLHDDAKRLASQMGIQFFECSAKMDINVEEMFRCITDLVLVFTKARKENLDRPDQRHGGIKLDPRRPNGGNKKDKKSCCK